MRADQMAETAIVGRMYRAVVDSGSFRKWWMYRARECVEHAFQFWRVHTHVEEAVVNFDGGRD